MCRRLSQPLQLQPELLFFRTGVEFIYFDMTMQNLKQKIVDDKENASKQNLAEIAAQQSARILEETKARSQLGSGVLILTHVVYLMIGVLSVLACGLHELALRID